MLKRISANEFEGPTGSQVRLIVKSSNNSGVEDARFEYDSTTLGRDSHSGHPSCSFTVMRGMKTCEAVVAFASGASAGARYDLFEIDSEGGETDLEEFVTINGTLPLINIGIRGVAGAAPEARALLGGKKAPKRKKPRRRP